MRISIIGLGYVGVVSSACFANEGHSVIGVDVDSKKVELINNKISPIVEKDLDKYIKKAVEDKKLVATNDLNYAIKNSDISFICVGTPSKQNGEIDLKYIKEVSKEIAKALKEKKKFHIVATRSTVMPNTARSVIIPTLEKNSGKKLSKGFGYISNPEFLRESTAIWDFYNPPKTVIGYSDKKSANTFKKLYSFLNAPYFETEIEVAEMIKYADNSWHATKVTFANEIGLVCKKLNIDSHKVMDIFCADTKLNISPYYLKPGFAFGGSCLPKDVRALTHKAKKEEVETKLLNSLIPSNEYQIRRVYNEYIKPAGYKKVALLGLSFKANTDDLRGSPLLELAELLIGKGVHLKIYDKNINISKKKGALQEYLENELWHIDRVLQNSIEDTIKDTQLVIIGNRDEEFKNIAKNIKNRTILDLVRVDNKINSNKKYIGLAW